MSTLRTLALTAVLALAAAPAVAQSAAPSVPSPTNPFPENPIATDGSSLAGALYGRDAFRGRFVSEVRSAAPVRAAR